MRASQIILLLLLLFNIANAEDFSGLYQDLRSDSQQYSSQGSIDSTKDIAPQYDESKATYDGAQDSDTAATFLEMGSSITDSCTVTINELTKEAECEDRTEYEYINTSVEQSKILTNINYEAEDFINDKIVYYCAENDTIYSTNSQCTANCTYQTCDSGYYMSGSQCYSAPSCQTGYTYSTSLNKCVDTIGQYTCSTGGNYTSYQTCTASCSASINATISGTYVMTELEDALNNYNGCIGQKLNYANQTSVSWEQALRVNMFSTACTTQWRTITLEKGGPEVCGVMYTGDSSYKSCDSFLNDGTILRKVYNGTVLTNQFALVEGTPTYSCPSGYTLSGTTCTSNGICSDTSYDVYVNATCTYGGILNGTTDKCVDSTNTNYTACESQTEYFDDVRYNAVLEYILSPANFDPLINCIMGAFSCVDWRSTCMQYNSSNQCNRYQNICWQYDRGGTCQRVEEHIYTTCSYNTTSSPVE